MGDFRFSCNVFAVRSRDHFVGYCQDAERYGYNTVFTTDHLGSPGPFPPLVLAAEATERIRVGVLVLNVPFWNAHLLAREVATVDVLTSGRVELGLGAGDMKWEFDAAGLPWAPHRERVAAVESALDELERLFSGPGHPERREGDEFYSRPVLRPVQRRGLNGSGPPVIIGGTGDRAADPELNVLVQAVVVTPDRRAAAERLVADVGLNLSPDEAPDTPFLLIGTVAEIAAQLRERRDRFGVSHITVHEPYMATLAPVIVQLR